MNNIVAKDPIPHLKINVSVRDQSIEVPEIPLTPANYTALQPFFSNKGPINKKIKVTELSEFIELFGEECLKNPEIYGYGGIIIEQILRGGGEAIVSRLENEEKAKKASCVIALGIPHPSLETIEKNKLINEGIIKYKPYKYQNNKKIQLKDNNGVLLWEHDDSGNPILDKDGQKIPVYELAEKEKHLILEHDDIHEIRDLDSKPHKIANADYRLCVVKKVYQIGEGMIRSSKNWKEPFSDKHSEKYVDPKNKLEIKKKDTDFMFFPIMKIESSFTGKYGNNYEVELNIDSSEKNEKSIGRKYRLDFYEELIKYPMRQRKNINPDSGNGLIFSFDPESKISLNSQISDYFNDMYKKIILDDENLKNYPFQLEINQKNYETFLKIIQNYTIWKKKLVKGEIDYYEDNIENDNSGGSSKQFEEHTKKLELLKNKYPDLNVYNEILENKLNFDFISLKNKEERYLNMFRDVSNTTNTFKLKGGKDYVTEESSTKEDILERAKRKNAELSKFFNYETIPEMLDSRIVPSGVTYDAAFDNGIKKIMVSNYLKYRQDMTVYIDGGITDNRVENLYVYEQVIKEAGVSDIDNSRSYRIRFVPQSGIADHRGKLLAVPGTYEIARSKSRLMARTPYEIYAGTTRGKILYYKPNWIGKISINGKDIGKLEETNSFYIIQYGQDDKDLAYFSDKNCYGIFNSQIKSIRNSDIITDGIRIAKFMLINYVFSDENIEDLEEEISQKFSNIVSSRYPDSIEISIKLNQSKYDRLQKRYSVFVEYKFPDVPEKFNVELIALNKAEV